jgi:hypothetical protein
LLKIKAGYIQTDEGGVNTQYNSNNKQKMGTYPVNIYGWLIFRVAHLFSVLCSPIMCFDALGSVL